MKITFRKLFEKLDSGEKIDGIISYKGKTIQVKNGDGWCLYVEDKPLCMNMSSKSLDEECDYSKNIAIGFTRRHSKGENPVLVFDGVAEGNCTTGFGGSGTTLIACEQTDRKGYLMELDPHYCDVIRKRYWKFVNGSEEGWQDGTKAIDSTPA